MHTIQDFFDIFEFLRNNPQSELDQTLELRSDIFQNQTAAINSSIVFEDGGIESTDTIKMNAALLARSKAKDYFDKVLYQTAYNTADYNLLRDYIRDWYASHKTIQDLMQQATDAYSLPSDDIDLAIEGFGAPIFNKSLINDKYTRATLLLSLAELYKIKGSPQSILSALGFIGFGNVSMREWWTERNPKLLTDLNMRGIAINRGQTFNEQDGIYVPTEDRDLEDELISWDSFKKRLAELGDPHWQYSRSEILAVDNDPDVHMKLPSITPYYSLTFNADVSKIDQVLGMLEYQIIEDFNNFINGNDYKHFTSIEGYGSPLSITELYLAYSYTQARADEDNKYLHLRDYLVNDNNYTPPVYSYPHSYEKLILWVDQNVTTDDIDKYTPSYYNYYAATNELVAWWNSEPALAGNPIPDIYYDKFLFSREPVIQTNDKKLQYTGDQFVEGTTELDYAKILNDYQTLLYETPFNRIIKNSEYNTTTPSNEVIDDTELMQDLQQEYQDTAYIDIYQTGSETIDRTSHDGSTLLPNSIGVAGTWAIDDNYLYRCVDANSWVRHSIENKPWAAPTPPAELPDKCDCGNIGSFYYDNSYIYWQSSRCSQVRFIVEDSWTVATGTGILPNSLGTANDFVNDINYYYFCISTDTWVRHTVENTWDDSLPRLAVFVGEELIYPTLDLTNRYDADRILRGAPPVGSPSDLDDIGSYEGKTVIVKNDSTDCLPRVYEYQYIEVSSSSSGTDPLLGWLPSATKGINDVNIGLNNSLILWIEEQATFVVVDEDDLDYNRSQFGPMAESLLVELSGYISSTFRSAGIDLASYFIRFRGSEALFKVIDFFKPKRARLLFFALSVIFDDRLHNTVKTDEGVDTTKIIQQLDTFIPKQDASYVYPESGLYNRRYHYDDPNEAYDIGAFNHWNTKHPRPVDLKATIQTGRDSSTNWAYGYCIDYPRPAFPTGESTIHGYPETVDDGDRLGVYDAYTDIDTQQPGPISNEETVDSGLDDEHELIIRGSINHITLSEPNTKIGESSPSEDDTTSVSGLTIERPVYHRPVYIALKDLQYECYPARPPSCCDYYDVGCIHDGEGNPSYDLWDGTQWVATPESYTQLEDGQRNPGDTYCTDCDVGNYTPDLDQNNIPEEWIAAGVYHTEIEARGFTGTLTWVNGSWDSFAITSTTNTYVWDTGTSSYIISTEYIPYDFSVRGYRQQTQLHEIVHVHHKPTGFQFWELRQYRNDAFVTGWVAVARTKLKDLVHTSDDLDDDNVANFQIERENFLNSTDFDVADDPWTDMNGVDVAGRVSSSIWIRSLVEDSWGSPAPIYPNSAGHKSQRDCDGTYIYICKEDNDWIRFQIEVVWADTYVSSTTIPNSEGIIYRNNYAYLYVSTDNYKGWVRVPVDTAWVFPNDILPTSETVATSDFRYVNGALSYMYWTVMDTSGSIEMVCPDIIPFIETYRGIWELEKKAGDVWCTKHHVWDEFDYYYVITFRDAIRRVFGWKWNTWEMYETGQLQEATWAELSEPAWEDLEDDMADSEPHISEEEWDGIRSNVYAVYDNFSSSSSSGTAEPVGGYLYWFNLLTVKFPYITWPPYVPDLVKNSDADYWNVYEKTDITIYHPFSDSLIATDDSEIYVLEYGELITESEWPYPAVLKMTEDCQFIKISESGLWKIQELDNLPNWECSSSSTL